MLITPRPYISLCSGGPARYLLYNSLFSTKRVPIVGVCRQLRRSPISQSRIRAMSSNTPSSSSPPPISHILETCLYVKDLPASTKFYKETFNVPPLLDTPRVSAFSLGHTTLLLFQIGQSHEDVHLPNGTIPGHGPTESIRSSLLTPNGTHVEKLKQHFCFAVKDPEDVDKWDEHLRKQGVNVTARMKWERGGRSVYFEDPDGHVGEIASRGLWKHY